MKQFDEIKKLVSIGLKQMEADPLHNFDWRLRRQIYRNLIDIDQGAGSSHFATVIIMAADHVLPIFQKSFPEDTLPKVLIKTAKDLIDGKLSKDDPKLAEILDDGYLSTGIDNLTWRKTINYSAEYVGNTCYKALVEVENGYSLLEGIESAPRKYARNFLGHIEKSGQDFFDKDFAHLAAFGDTAGSAAVAFSCEIDKFEIEPQMMRIFWCWWGNEAVRSVLKNSS